MEDPHDLGSVLLDPTGIKDFRFPLLEHQAILQAINKVLGKLLFRFRGGNPPVYAHAQDGLSGLA